MLHETESGKAKEASAKSENIKIKVAAGYSLLLSVVLVLVFITYHSFYKILSSIESLGNRNNGSTLVKNIASGISEIHTSSRIYSITFKPADYKSFLEIKESIGKMMDTLQIQLTQKREPEKADSLGALYHEYVICINNWIALNKSDRSNDFKKIAGIIRAQNDLLTRSQAAIPHSTTTTVTRLLERPVSGDSTGIPNSVKSNPRRTFFQKIFGYRNRNKEASFSSSRKVNQQITTEISFHADTSYYAQVDLILSAIKDTVTQTEVKKKLRETQIARLEVLLFNYQSALITKMNTLLRNIDLEDQDILAKKISGSEQTAKRASRILVYAELFALVVALIFIHMIFRDLTRSNYYKHLLEKEKLATEKLTRAKEDFLAMMSHEIRTPLTNIIGFSEQLENDSLKENQAEQVHSIASSSEHLLAIVNNILDYSKIESGSLAFEKIGFSFNDIVTETIEILRINAAKKKLQLIYQPPVDCDHILLLGDPFRLKQVLINLISNGIKFTETGYVKIETSVVESQQEYLLRCHVSDTGIGIDRDKLMTIFSDFSQADNSIARKYGGTGLGLPICKKIVEMQHGSIWLTSTPGQGSVFSFEIPYAKALANDYHLNNNTNYEHGEQLKNKKLLVVDDDPTMPVLLEPMLLSWQINYTFCTNSLQALDILHETAFDIIMLDIQMPEMDGFELIGRIKTECTTRNSGLKIVVCTANTMMNSNTETNPATEYLVLQKPFKKEELWKILCKTIEIQAINQYIPAPSIPEFNQQNYSLRNFTAYANEDPETLALFIKTFIAQTKIELTEMQNFSNLKDYKQVREIAHKLKNTFGQLEARDLLSGLSSLEASTVADVADTKEIEEQIVALNQACVKLFSQLEKELYFLNRDQKLIS